MKEERWRVKTLGRERACTRDWKKEQETLRRTMSEWKVASATAISIKRGKKTSCTPVTQDWCRKRVSPLGRLLLLYLGCPSFMECFLSVCLFLPVATLGPKTTDLGGRKLESRIEIDVNVNALWLGNFCYSTKSRLKLNLWPNPK